MFSSGSPLPGSSRSRSAVRPSGSAARHPPAQLVASFRHYYGPTMNAFEAAEAAGRADYLQGELEICSTATTPALTGSTSIPATYLRVDVTV